MKNPAHSSRVNVLGVQVASADYEGAVRVVVEAAEEGRGGCVCCANAHTLTVAARDEAYRRVLNEALLTVPDGMPVVWAQRLLGGRRLPDRVYGPTLMLKLCDAAAARGLPVYLYGGRAGVPERVREVLTAARPKLVVAGTCSPPFGPREPAAEAADLARIRESGARLVFVGLGAPKQERWAARAARELPAVLVAVGAAFDFHAGCVKQAPAWMQRCGLEWFYRLCREPRRLWRRYLFTNPYFVCKLFAQRFSRGRGQNDENDNGREHSTPPENP